MKEHDADKCRQSCSSYALEQVTLLTKIARLTGKPMEDSIRQVEKGAATGMAACGGTGIRNSDIKIDPSGPLEFHFQGDKNQNS